MTIVKAPPAPVGRQHGEEPPQQGWQFTSTHGLVLLLLLLVVGQGPIRRALSAPVMQSWMTVFLAVVVQALPFLVLGVLLSAALAVFVPPSFFARALPKRPGLAVPVAGVAGAVLPAASAPRCRSPGLWCAGAWRPRRRSHSCCPRPRSTRSC